MAEQFTSSPGPSDVRKYQTGQGSYQQTKTAFQSISQQVLLTPEALYSDPYVRYLGATDPLAQAREFNKLYAGLVGTAPSAGTKFNNAFQELQALLRAKGYSKGKSPLGIVEGADQSGLTKAIQDSLAMGQTDVIQFLSALSARPGAGPKQIDTTTKFSTQISRALQLKDIGDATNALTDAFMLAYSIAPGNELITDFQKKWNAEVEAQIPSTKSRNQVVMVPVYDSKTGKQKKDKDGKPKFKPLVDAKGVIQYEPVTTSDTVIPGEGFTAEEQTQFMANYLAVNFPTKQWNMDKIGGAAKTIYDAMVQASNNNLEKPPTFEEAAPIITKIIGTGNSQVASQLLGEYQSNVRSMTGKRFMSIAEDLAAGKDAKPLVDNLSNFFSEAFETYVGVDDPLMVRALNYVDDKGNYRLPNQFELTTLATEDRRYATTSRAINESVNLAQALKSQLQLG